MKRIVLIALFVLFAGMTCVGQSTYSRSSNGDFVAVKAARKTTGSSYQPTGKYYVDIDSIRYEIYIHTVTKGKNAGQTYCYIQKVSKKTGKPYWKRIDVKPEELK